MNKLPAKAQEAAFAGAMLIGIAVLVLTITAITSRDANERGLFVTVGAVLAIAGGGLLVTAYLKRNDVEPTRIAPLEHWMAWSLSAEDLHALRLAGECPPEDSAQITLGPRGPYWAGRYYPIEPFGDLVKVSLCPLPDTNRSALVIEYERVRGAMPIAAQLPLAAYLAAKLIHHSIPARKTTTVTIPIPPGHDAEAEALIQQYTTWFGR